MHLRFPLAPGEAAKLSGGGDGGDNGVGEAIEVFTTRVDTVFGTSYVAVAHDHPLVDALQTSASRSGKGCVVEVVCLAAASHCNVCDWCMFSDAVAAFVKQESERVAAPDEVSASFVWRRRGDGARIDLCTHCFRSRNQGAVTLDCAPSTHSHMRR